MASRKKGYMRSYKTAAQEKRMACRDDDYVRLKRNYNNCPDPWDWLMEKPICYKKSWKDRTKRKHQWREEPREKVEIFIDTSSDGTWYGVWGVVDKLRDEGYYVEVCCGECGKERWFCFEHDSKKIVYWK